MVSRLRGADSSGGDIYLAFEGLLKRQTASINGFAATPLRHCGALSTRASALETEIDLRKGSKQPLETQDGGCRAVEDQSKSGSNANVNNATCDWAGRCTPISGVHGNGGISTKNPISRFVM